MDAAETIEGEVAGGPRLSLLELRDWFEEHPTPDLVVAMCEQAKSGSNVFDFVRVFYSLEGVPAGRNALDWMEEQLTWLHRTLFEVGVSRFLASR